MFGQKTDGVKAGDWVLYSVTRLGPDKVAWGGPTMKRAVWVKVEVQNVSETVITARETIHLTDGSDSITTSSWDLQGVGLWVHSIIATNLGPGDKVGDFTLWVNETGEFKDVELTLNNTVSRSYGGVTREVNVLKFSQLVGFFEWWNNNTLEYYWDRETGFLLEKIWQTRYVEVGNTSMSTLRLEIADTNMWEMETEEFSSWQRLAVAIPVGAIIVAAVTIKLRNKKNGEKKNECLRTETKQRCMKNDEDESLCYGRCDSSTSPVSVESDSVRESQQLLERNLARLYPILWKSI